MTRRTLIALSGLISGGKWALLYRAVFFLVFITPGLLLVFFSYTRFYTESTESILSEKKMLALLASNIVHERLNAVVNLGVSFASRGKVIEEVRRGNWGQALSALKNIPRALPFIHRIVLYDPDAAIKADFPSDPDVIRQSRADRSWYRGVSAGWQPYISPVYRREDAKPRAHFVSAVFPIKADPEAAGGETVIGILELQLRLEIFQQWIQSADVEPGGFIYIVDQRGHLVAHPRIDNQEISIDFSPVPVVRKLLEGQRGAEFYYNPIEKEERFAAYEPVEHYGWGVVATHSAKAAFLKRNTTLRHLIIIYAIFIFLTMATAFFILYAMIAGRKSREALQRLAALVESSSDAIIGKDCDGIITSWNAGAERMYGYTSSEAAGKSIFMLAAEDLTKAEMKMFLARLCCGEPIENWETVRRRKDGSTVQVALTISPIKNDLGQIVGSSTIARDITGRKQAEKEREDLLASLQAALANVKTLHGMLPICSACKKIRNDEGYWERIETYIREHSDAEFTHGICPECAKKLYPKFYKE